MPPSHLAKQKAVIFALGTLGASVAIGTCFPTMIADDVVRVSATRALIGGLIMVFGSLVAGGCISGHGISGLASLFFSSLLSAAAMFIAGIAASSALSLVKA
jgi:uncharacterized membrane protein YedE/YeeE